MTAIRELTLWRADALVRRLGPPDAAAGRPEPSELAWRCGCTALRHGAETYRWLRCPQHEPIPQFLTG